MRLAVLTSHPIQYYAPLFRELARRMDLIVYFAHRATPRQQADAGFGEAFEWDVDLLEGYESVFLRNVASDPGVHHFAGCDTPDVGARLQLDKANALLVTGWNLKTFWQGLWAAKQRGLSVLARGDSHLGSRRSLAKQAIKEALYPAFLNLYDAGLYVGQRNRDYWRHYRYPSNRLFFSPHCVDTEFFSRRAGHSPRAEVRARIGVSDDVPIALFAGRLVGFKRPMDLVESAALLRSSGADLQILVAGSGELLDPMKSRADALGVPLHALGFQNQTQMPAAYAASDVLVLPSDETETWGLVANEALACRRPVIVSDRVGCAPDLTTGNNVGRAYAFGHADALAAALSATLKHKPRSTDFEAIIERHSLASAAHGIEEASAAVSRKRARAA